MVESYLTMAVLVRIETSTSNTPGVRLSAWLTMYPHEGHHRPSTFSFAVRIVSWTGRLAPAAPRHCLTANKTVLWAATVLALAATAFPYVAPVFLES